MNYLELFILAIGLSMDAFAVSICMGLTSKKASFVNMAKCGGWFGGFQALMPLIGYILGSLFAKQIENIDHWVAFILLIIIGANMIREAVSDKDDSEKSSDFSAKTMFTLAVATSIDALAVGVSLSLAGNVNIIVAVILIGVITALLSAAGVKIGAAFGGKFEKKAEITGGVILILIGIKILLQHLGVI